jgi:hypothetical protein
MVSTVNLGSVGTIGDLFLPTKGVTSIVSTSSAESIEQQCPKQACPSGQKCCASVEISVESSSLSPCPVACSNGQTACASEECLCNGKSCPGSGQEKLAFEEQVAVPKKTCCAESTCGLCDPTDPVGQSFCGWLSVADQQPIDAIVCLGTPDELPLTTSTCKSECDLATEVELTAPNTFRFVERRRGLLRSPTREHPGLTENA